MGLGDWIMATADAKEVNERHGVRVVFGDGDKKHYSEVFDRNPRIAKELNKGERFAWIRNHPSCRPYIKQIHKDHFDFHEEFKVKPGELYPSNPQKDNGYIIVEPNVKNAFMLGRNKAWERNNWIELVKHLDNWKQLGTGGFLDKDHAIITPTFDDALNVLAGAKLLITTDGALHHAAAALGIHAIVLWGGVASPKNLGYDSHINIWHGDKPCGSHSKLCEHCRQAMAKITVKEVLEAYERSQRNMVAEPRNTLGIVRKAGRPRKVDLSGQQATSRV